MKRPAHKQWSEDNEVERIDAVFRILNVEIIPFEKLITDTLLSSYECGGSKCDRYINSVVEEKSKLLLEKSTRKQDFIQECET